MTKLLAFIFTAISCFFAGVIAADYLAGDIERAWFAVILITGSSFLTWICMADANNQRRAWRK